MQALFKEKSCREYVGLRLWRQGSPLSENYWRPRLRRFGRMADRVLWVVDRLAARLERDEEGETLQDKVARRPNSVDNIEDHGA
jgi:hypothetical protein